MSERVVEMKQHDADLRAVAEMAIAKCDKHWGGDEPITSLEVRAIADSIVREFREKKAEVGK